MDNEAPIFKQYEMLRNEKRQNVHLVFSYLSAMYVAFGVFTKFILDNQPYNYLIFPTAIYVIVVPITGKLYKVNENTVRISVCLEVFFEPALNFVKLEKILENFKTDYKQGVVISFFSKSTTAPFMIAVATYVMYISFAIINYGEIMEFFSVLFALINGAGTYIVACFADEHHRVYHEGRKRLTEHLISSKAGESATNS
jgi:hypothetical protein